MTPDHDKARLLRRYVLGELSDEEHAAIEREYFVDDEALEQVSAAEDELIEDYLEHRLDAATRDRFERHYLSTPGHRARVSAIQGLMTAAARTGVSTAVRANSRSASTARWSRWSPFQQAALAASIALLVGVGAVWLFTAGRDAGDRQASGSSASSASPASPASSASSASSAAAAKPSQAPPPAVAGPTTPMAPATATPGAPAQAAPPSTSTRPPVVVTLSLSPIVVRGAGGAATITIPADADILLLRLQGDAGAPPLRRGRAVVRTVEGDVLWRGAVDIPRDMGPDLRALVRIPAARLRTGDLIVELHAIGTDGREAEQTRYTVSIKMARRQ